MVCEKRYNNLGDCATLAAMYLMMFARSPDVMTDIEFGKVKVYRSCRRRFRMSIVKSVKRAKPRLADAEHFEVSRKCKTNTIVSVIFIIHSYTIHFYFTDFRT